MSPGFRPTNKKGGPFLTKLTLIRHAEAEGNVFRRFHGITNSPLTENGHKQAEKLSVRMKNEPIDILYTSDLKRTFTTAEYICKSKKIKPIITKELREINGGEWENEPWDILPVKWPKEYNNWENKPHLLKMPGGETMIEFQNRIKKEILRIIDENIGKKICVVTHGTVIKALLCYFKGVDLCNLHKLKWHDNASITIVNINNGKYTVVMEGDNSHLGDLSTFAKQDWWKTDELALINEKG